MRPSTLGHIHRFDRNDTGRDLVVGDIHGHFSRLELALRAVAFDPARDRLFSVGDLADRGPESLAALDWLSQPWFHAVRGNHEDYAVRYHTVDTENWVMNGGGWFLVLPASIQARVCAAFTALPFAIEVETDAGKVGIVHADCPTDDWGDLDTVLLRRSARTTCIWSRTRITEWDCRPVAGVRAVVVGHTPLHEPAVLGNVHFIDTGGWTSHGRFTLLDLSTLTAAVA